MTTMTTQTPKYRPGEPVMLGEHEGTPRQAAYVLSVDVLPWGISYVVEVLPEGPGDDGLRELTEDQIEGRIGPRPTLH